MTLSFSPDAAGAFVTLQADAKPVQKYHGDGGA
jgi:hypothetical protein